MNSVLQSNPAFNLLIEASGSNQQHDSEKMEGFLSHCLESGLAQDGMMVSGQPPSFHFFLPLAGRKWRGLGVLVETTRKRVVGVELRRLRVQARPFAAARPLLRADRSGARAAGGKPGEASRHFRPRGRREHALERDGGEIRRRDFRSVSRHSLVSVANRLLSIVPVHLRVGPRARREHFGGARNRPSQTALPPRPRPADYPTNQLADQTRLRSTRHPFALQDG